MIVLFPSKVDVTFGADVNGRPVTVTLHGRNTNQQWNMVNNHATNLYPVIFDGNEVGIGTVQ